MKLVSLQKFNTAIEAHIVKSRLEDAGIHAVLFDENVAPLTGIFNQSLSAIKLMVNESDLAKAIELLNNKVEED